MQVREHWGSKVGFVLAAIGSTIGLGLLWKFPYVIGQNGGGLFLLVYFFCIVVIAVPLFVGEIILGRASQRAAIGAFEELEPRVRGWRIGGVLGVLASFLIMSFYSVIAGWGMSYVLMSLTGLYRGLSLDGVQGAFRVLSHSGSITLLWHFLFTLITMGIVFSGVRKGIEYWSKLMVRVLLILLVGLFLFSTTLEGFSKAVEFIFYPKLGDLTPSGILEALGLAFMTMSLGQGIMISYGSYLKSEENIAKMAGIIGGSVILVAILAALTIFPVIFTFGLAPDSGPGLVFETLPYLFAQLPGSLVVSTVFFSLFVFTALTSAIPLIEVVATNIMEIYGLGRKKAVTIVGTLTFVVGIPSAFAINGSIFPEWKEIFGMNFLDTINELVSIWVIPIAGLVTSIFLGWQLEKQQTKKEFLKGSGSRGLFHAWHFLVRWCIPVVIILIILQKSGLIEIT